MKECLLAGRKKIAVLISITTIYIWGEWLETSLQLEEVALNFFMVDLYKAKSYKGDRTHFCPSFKTPSCPESLLLKAIHNMSSIAMPPTSLD